MNDDDGYSLLANPYFIKSLKDNKEDLNVDKCIIDILNKKYKDSLITIEDEKKILKKIESLFVFYTIKNTVKETLNNIITSIIINNFDGRILL